MTTKSTPGPWIVEPLEPNEHGVMVYSIDQSDEANFEYGKDAHCSHLAEVYENEATANIMAAAWELLEALENLVEERKIKALHKESLLILQSQAAIRKAKGL